MVLFSHGFAGFPEQSAHLTTHLASWGYVVAAPDHVERSLSGLLGTAGEGVERREDPDVLQATLDLVLAQADEDASPLAGMVDGERVAASGHSAGAGAAYRLASQDERVDVLAAYSLGLRAPEGGEPPPVPDVPALVMLGEDDGVIEADRTRDAFDALDRPKYLVALGDSGHLVFSDLCLIGAAQGGLVGIVERLELPVPDDLLDLARDGCGDEALPVEHAFGAVDAVSVAFLRAHLAGDEEAADALAAGDPGGLGPAPVELVADP